MTETILTRASRSLSYHPPRLNESQGRADAMISSFVDHATDGYALAGMVGGGLVYRLGRVGTLALGSRLIGESTGILPQVVRVGSVGVGFTGEVFTFEAGQRALRVGLGGADPSILNWGGENGLGRGTLTAAITLGSLKGAGAFVQGQNIALQHLFQDSAMVFAHNVSGAAGLTSRPQGSLAEQMVNAEATLWQLNAGMSLVHGAFPRLGQLERSLDLSTRSRAAFLPSENRRGESLSPELALQAAGIGGRANGADAPFGPFTMLMTAMDGRENGGGGAPEGRPASEARQALEAVLARYTQTTDGKSRREMRTELEARMAELVQRFRQDPEALRQALDSLRESAEAGEVAEALAPVMRELRNPNRSPDANARAARTVLEQMPLNAPSFMSVRHLPANLVTAAAAICAFVSMRYAMQGEVDTAAVLLPIAAVLDKLDGTVARALKASHPIGERLDSYADFSAYGMASAIFARAVLESHGYSALGDTAAAIIFSHALLRLAVFDFLGEHGNVLPSHDVIGNPVSRSRSDFMGMPSTMVGLYIPLLYALFGRDNPEAFYAGSALIGSAMFWPLRFVKFESNFKSRFPDGQGNYLPDADNPWRRPMTLAYLLGPAGIGAALGIAQGDLRTAGFGLFAGLAGYVVSPFMERAALAINRWRQRRIPPPPRSNILPPLPGATGLGDAAEEGPPSDGQREVPPVVRSDTDQQQR